MLLTQIALRSSAAEAFCNSAAEALNRFGCRLHFLHADKKFEKPMHATQDQAREAQGLTCTSQTFNLALQLCDLSVLCSRSDLSLALMSTM